MDTGGKSKGRQLTFAKNLLHADWFIHILMFSLYHTPAVSFCLQIKKSRLRNFKVMFMVIQVPSGTLRI